MDAGSSDSFGGAAAVCVPPDDGLIEQALIELDEKLSAWFSAMRRAGDDLGAFATGSARAVAEEPVCETVEPVSPEPALPEAEATPPPVPDHLERDIAVLPDERPPHVGAPVGRDTPRGIVAPADPELEPGPQPAPPATQEDDQALLDSLDPEIAREIRVLHRLNPGRSMRELIEQHQTRGQSATLSTPAKRSWWRRPR